MLEVKQLKREYKRKNGELEKIARDPASPANLRCRVIIPSLSVSHSLIPLGYTIYISYYLISLDTLLVHSSAFRLDLSAASQRKIFPGRAVVYGREVGLLPP